MICSHVRLFDLLSPFYTFKMHCLKSLDCNKTEFIYSLLVNAPPAPKGSFLKGVSKKWLKNSLKTSQFLNLNSLNPSRDIHM